MFNPNVGIYLYRVVIKKSRSSKVRIEDLQNPSFDQCVQDFVSLNLEQNLGDDISRRWYVSRAKEREDGRQLRFEYGRTGFGSKLLDGKTRRLNYDRKTSDIEVVPLLSRVWFPRTGGYAIWAFQSFGQYSCNGLVLSDFIAYCKSRWENIVVQIDPIVPTHLEDYQSAPVTAVTLRKRGNSDAASAQISKSAAELVDIDVRISSLRGGKLGKLRDLLPRFKGDDPAGREFGGQEYDLAYATVSVGEKGRSRTVSLYGPARGTGLIDLDEEVKKVGGHPLEDDFFRIADDLIGGVVREVGID